MGTFLPGIGTIGWVLFGLALLWSAVWKGIALWRAARNGHLAWFIVMLIFNTVGILEIVYILAFSRKKTEQVQHS